MSIFDLYATVSPKRFKIGPKLLLSTNRKLHMQMPIFIQSRTASHTFHFNAVDCAELKHHTNGNLN